MSYQFDLYGWYTGEATGRRTTDIEPVNKSVTEVEGESRSMWVETGWVSIPYKAPPPVVPDVSALLADVRAQAQEVILAKYPLWYQANCANGVYPSDVATAMQDAIALVIVESNRVEDLITAGTPEAPNWPQL